MAAARAQIKGKHRQELACDWLLFVLVSKLGASVNYVCVQKETLTAVWTGNVWKQEFYINTLRTGSFKLFKRTFPGFLTILTL